MNQVVRAMERQVAFILILAMSFSFSVLIKGAEEAETPYPAKELEQLLVLNLPMVLKIAENRDDDNRLQADTSCRDMYIYWCRRYSSRCSYPIVYSYCPRTCRRCPVVSGWSSWTAYSRCSKTCYYGFQTRSRKCSSVSPSACQGPSVESQRCKERVSCLKDNVGSNSALTSIQGVWTQWGSYSKCTKSCGSGLQSRVRTCLNPSHSSGHKRCPGPFRQHRPCNQKSCPVDGGWTSWGRFRQCSKTCGGGKQYKQRFCKNPSPKGGGKFCQGPYKISRECNTQPCAVHGNWSPWSVFGLCSRTCGGGTKHRSRFCNNPAPSSGGNTCSGPSRQSIACNTQACAVHGHWSLWGAFGSCSRSCGGGKQYRRRACNNPASSSGGNACNGPSRQSKTCNIHVCPVDGHWSSWSAFGPCSRTCGGGTQYRRRVCDNPAPSPSGKTCSGQSRQSKSCNTHECVGCRDAQSYKFCSYVVMSYQCGQYYLYCRKTCNACEYRMRAY